MPSFNAHQQFNYFILIPIMIASYQLAGLEFTCFLFLGYVLGTEILSPDLDTDSTPYHRLGLIAWPYKVMFKHRRTSHKLIMGFVSRLGYAALILTFPLWILYHDFPIMQTLTLLFGILLANVMHVVRDKID